MWFCRGKTVAIHHYGYAEGLIAFHLERLSSLMMLARFHWGVSGKIAENG